MLAIVNIARRGRRAFSARNLASGIKTAEEKISGATTVDNNEIETLSKLSDEWWKENGPMKALHSLNELRVPLIRDGLLGSSPSSETKVNTPRPLRGFKILDVGCGAGILSEPLARLGADVTGLDASERLIGSAENHSKSSENPRYVCDSIEAFSEIHRAEYDAVVASEVIEHVADADLFVGSCANTLKPGGSMFLTTLNRSGLSWVGAIVFAERLLRLVPPGTHRWDKFISPRELDKLLDKNGCRTRLVHGMMYDFVNDRWCWSSNTAINYAIHAVKNVD